jgi:CRP-like cAMP-binding protein
MKQAPQQAEDALEYLPYTVPVAYEKGQTIYGGGVASAGFYVVLQGRVKVWRAGNNGHGMVLGIYGPEQIFGEKSVIGGNPDEFATALEKTQLMSWSLASIEDQITKSPRLAIALMQIMAARGVGLKTRIKYTGSEKTPARVALALLEIAKEVGSRAEDGAVCFNSLTHQTISELVGTSREIVTAEMGNLRRFGVLQYSRKETRVYCEAMEEHIQTRARLPQPPRQRRAPNAA